MSNTKFITAYAAHKLVNEALEAAGVVDVKKGTTKKIPGPMMYTYVNKGYIPSKDGLVEVEGFKVWLAKYIERNLAKQGAELDEQAKFDLAEAE